MRLLIAILFMLPFTVAAHDIVCEHKHVNFLRVECAQEFAPCKQNSKDGCCVTKLTHGLVKTMDCHCITSDKQEPQEPILLDFKGFEMELRAKPVN